MSPPSPASASPLRHGSARPSQARRPPLRRQRRPAVELRARPPEPRALPADEDQDAGHGHMWVLRLALASAHPPSPAIICSSNPGETNEARRRDLRLPTLPSAASSGPSCRIGPFHRQSPLMSDPHLLFVDRPPSSRVGRRPRLHLGLPARGPGGRLRHLARPEHRLQPMSPVPSRPRNVRSLNIFRTSRTASDTCPGEKRARPRPGLGPPSCPKSPPTPVFAAFSEIPAHSGRWAALAL